MRPPGCQRGSEKPYRATPRIRGFCDPDREPSSPSLSERAPANHGLPWRNPGLTVDEAIRRSPGKHAALHRDRFFSSFVRRSRPKSFQFFASRLPNRSCKAKKARIRFELINQQAAKGWSETEKAKTTTFPHQAWSCP